MARRGRGPRRARRRHVPAGAAAADPVVDRRRVARRRAAADDRGLPRALRQFRHRRFSIPLALVYRAVAQTVGLDEFLMRLPMLVCGLLTLVLGALWACATGVAGRRGILRRVPRGLATARQLQPQRTALRHHAAAGCRRGSRPGAVGCRARAAARPCLRRRQLARDLAAPGKRAVPADAAGLPLRPRRGAGGAQRRVAARPADVHAGTRSRRRACRGSGAPACLGSGGPRHQDRPGSAAAGDARRRAARLDRHRLRDRGRRLRRAGHCRRPRAVARAAAGGDAVAGRTRARRSPPCW